MVRLLSLFEFGDKLTGRVEADSIPFATSAAPEPLGQMRLAGPDVADQTTVESLGNPLATSQLQNVLLIQVRRLAEVEGVEILAGGEAGRFHAGRECVGLPGSRITSVFAEHLVIVIKRPPDPRRWYGESRQS